MTRKQREAPLCDPVREWFIANPHETLTVNDVAIKFGIDRTQANTAVQRLVKKEIIEPLPLVYQVRR